MKASGYFFLVVFIFGLWQYFDIVPNPTTTLKSQTPKVDVDKTIKTTPQELAVLKRSCFDCHSNETVYPWYAMVFPLNYKITSNIKYGRKALNFSEWANIDNEIKIKRLNRAIQLVKNEMMPPSEYTIFHKEAILDNVSKGILVTLFEKNLENIRQSR